MAVQGRYLEGGTHWVLRSNGREPARHGKMGMGPRTVRAREVLAVGTGHVPPVCTSCNCLYPAGCAVFFSVGQFQRSATSLWGLSWLLPCCHAARSRTKWEAAGLTASAYDTWQLGGWPGRRALPRLLRLSPLSRSRPHSSLQSASLTAGPWPRQSPSQRVTDHRYGIAVSVNRMKERRGETGPRGGLPSTASGIWGRIPLSAHEIATCRLGSSLGSSSRPMSDLSAVPLLAGLRYRALAETKLWGSQGDQINSSIDRAAAPIHRHGPRRGPAHSRGQANLRDPRRVRWLNVCYLVVSAGDRYQEREGASQTHSSQMTTNQAGRSPAPLQ